MEVINTVTVDSKYISDKLDKMQEKIAKNLEKAIVRLRTYQLTIENGNPTDGNHSDQAIQEIVTLLRKLYVMTLLNDDKIVTWDDLLSDEEIEFYNAYED